MPVADKRPDRKRLLAIDPSFGSVYLCGHCEHIHLDFGELHFKTDLDAFQSLVVLVNRAAANFELWAELARLESEGADRPCSGDQARPEQGRPEQAGPEQTGWAA